MMAGYAQYESAAVGIEHMFECIVRNGKLMARGLQIHEQKELRRGLDSFFAMPYKQKFIRAF
jgi:hypothetical protein